MAEAFAASFSHGRVKPANQDGKPVNRANLESDWLSKLLRVIWADPLTANVSQDAAGIRRSTPVTQTVTQARQKAPT